MAKTSPIVDRECSPPCVVHNEVPPRPGLAMVNKYGGDPRVNTQPDPKMRIKESTAEYPEHVLPEGQTL